MAPEQLASLQAERSVVVDARSDLYSFGVILFELLTGRYPFEHRNPAPTSDFDAILEERRSAPLSLRKLNPAVSPALEAIVLRCLAPDPSQRYESARQLKEDLHRQHTYQTLLHTVEPSRSERLHKWRRRHPRIVAATLVALCAGIVIGATTSILMIRGSEIDRLTDREHDRVKRENERNEADSALRDFHDNLKTTQFLLYTRTNEPEQLASGIRFATKLINRYGVIENPDWQQSTLVQSLPDVSQRALADSMAELLLLLGRAQILRHDDPVPPGREEILRQVLLMNDRAAACSEQAIASPALWHQRAKVQTLLGANTEAFRCQEHAKTLRLRTAADHYWLGSDYISDGRLRDALPLLQRATRLNPASFWAWFVLGNCCDRLGLDARAEGCYGTCIALKPDFHWSYFNRGLALYRQQDYRSAISDFDAVVISQPNLAEAYLNRALCHQWLRQYREAEQDLSIAIARGGPSRIYFLRARSREKLGDRPGAQRDIEETLCRPPTDEKSWIARGIYRLNSDPKAALADFEQALRINQRSADALQNQAHVLAEKLGRTKESLQALNRLLELYPDSVKARSGRGVVLARMGQRAAAIRDAEETLQRDASPPRLYQAACIYALTSKQQPGDHLRAFQLLSAALRSGYGLQYLDIDHDLDPIRPLPEFRRLSDAARAIRSAPSSKKT